jgi:hypothetical protein
VKLETHTGVVADPATIDDIDRTIFDLTEPVERPYVILNDDLDPGDETYVQAAGTVGEDFLVERRDGCAGEHYRVDRRMAAGELAALFRSYLRGEPEWSCAVEWHRIVADDDARPKA